MNIFRKTKTDNVFYAKFSTIKDKLNTVDAEELTTEDCLNELFDNAPYDTYDLCLTDTHSNEFAINVNATKKEITVYDKGNNMETYVKPLPDSQMEIYVMVDGKLIEKSRINEQELAIAVEQDVVRLFAFTRVLQEKQLYVASKERVWKSAKGKYTEKNVSYISLKKYLKSDYKGDIGLSWKRYASVRGHWRELRPNSLGKNRNGEYEELGRTWVTPHERNAELKKSNKIKVLQ